MLRQDLQARQALTTILGGKCVDHASYLRHCDTLDFICSNNDSIVIAVPKKLLEASRCKD